MVFVVLVLVQQKVDGCFVVVIDFGYGGIDNGMQLSGESEKNLVLVFVLVFCDRLEKVGKYCVVMMWDDDIFILFNDWIKIVCNFKVVLFVLIYVDVLFCVEGDVQGVIIYMLFDKVFDVEVQWLVDVENWVDVIVGINLVEEFIDVVDILIDLM